MCLMSSQAPKTNTITPWLRMNLIGQICLTEGRQPVGYVNECFFVSAIMCASEHNNILYIVDRYV